MLSTGENHRLTRVGAGTPAGELIRRYWMPFLQSADLPENDGEPVRITLLGESLLAFRDTSGRVGLVQRNCPHRWADLFFGRNEEEGLPPPTRAAGAARRSARRSGSPRRRRTRR